MQESHEVSPRAPRTGAPSEADDLPLNYDELADAYSRQIEHTNRLRAEYQERVASLQARAVRAVRERDAWHGTVRAIEAVLYDGDSPDISDLAAAARENPPNMARCYQSIRLLVDGALAQYAEDTAAARPTPGEPTNG